MKNKNINKVISEELDKISKLFHYQRGKVISEQTTDVGADVGNMMRQLDAFNTNEDEVVNIIKKYKNKQEFKNFVNQYKSITGKDFGVGLHTAINPSSDKKEWGELKTYLETLGVTLGSTTTNKGKGTTATFGGLDGSVTSAPTQDKLNKREARWETDLNCVKIQPNATKITLKDKTTAYKISDTIYYNNGRKKVGNAAPVNYSCKTEFKTENKTNNSQQNREKIKLQNQNITNEIQRTAGLPETGTLDTQSIQKLIDMLSDVERPKVQSVNSLIPSGIKTTDAGEQLKQMASQLKIRQ